MPLYTFKNLETNEEYDEVMSYEELQKYLTQDNIQQVFKFNMFRKGHLCPVCINYYKFIYIYLILPVQPISRHHILKHIDSLIKSKNNQI